MHRKINDVFFNDARCCIASNSFKCLHICMLHNPMLNIVYFMTSLMPVFCLLQPPINYSGLTERGRRKVQADYRLHGLCYSYGYLFVAGHRLESDMCRTGLFVYRVQGDSDDITLLDYLDMDMRKPHWHPHPRVDHHRWRVFIPWNDSNVIVVRLAGDKLVRDRTLTCISRVRSVDVMSSDTVYVSNWEFVHTVDVREDKITSILEKPETMRDHDRMPVGLTVLGDSVLVNYSSAVVLYYHGSPAPVRVIGLSHTWLGLNAAVSTDHHQHFLVYTSPNTKFVDTGKMTGTSMVASVLVMDVSGNVRHTIQIDTDSYIRDCAVVNRQLWLASKDGNIIIMSSQ